MTLHEALSFLAPLDKDDSFEKWEEELFEIRQQILDKSHVPALLNKRKERLLIWKKVGDKLGFEIGDNLSHIKLKPLPKHSLIESFQVFQINEAQIKSCLFSALTISNLLFCIEQFQENLKAWYNCLPKWTSEQKVLLGIKPDVMELLKECQQMSDNGIKLFQQLTIENCAPALKKEILRLNNIFNS